MREQWISIFVNTSKPVHKDFVWLLFLHNPADHLPQISNLKIDLFENTQMTQGLEFFACIGRLYMEHAVWRMVCEGCSCFFLSVLHFNFNQN